MENLEVVFTVQTPITYAQLLIWVNAINKGMWKDEEPLTIEEVTSKPDLLKYICDEAVEDGRAVYDPDDFINDDGWMDLEKFR